MSLFVASQKRAVSVSEVFFVGVPADAVQAHAEKQGDGQHRQPGVAPQLDVVGVLKLALST